MKKSSPVEATQLFVGALYSKPDFFITVRERLKMNFGDIVMESPEINYTHSDYYRDELGWPLTRKFIFFGNKIDPLSLPDIKHSTNTLEEALASSGNRNINIDPGYMTLSKVVLASTKNYSHRLYIGKGIFAELTLVHVKGRYRPHLFTYRDYASDECAQIFAAARKFLR